MTTALVAGNQNYLPSETLGSGINGVKQQKCGVIAIVRVCRGSLEDEGGEARR